MFCPITDDLVPRPAGVPLAGGLGAAVFLLFAEPRSPLLPSGRHRRALQQRAGKPTAAHLRSQGQESYRHGAQAGVHR